jgi:predicted RNA-binding protein with RPS1 domain
MFIDKSQSYLRYKELWYLAKLKEDFEDTKGVLSIRKSKKDTQHNGQKKRNPVRNHSRFKIRNSRFNILSSRFEIQYIDQLINRTLLNKH